MNNMKIKRGNFPRSKNDFNDLSDKTKKDSQLKLQLDQNYDELMIEHKKLKHLR